MPKMDGYEATKHIRQYIKNLKVEQPIIIAVSGHLEE